MAATDVSLTFQQSCTNLHVNAMIKKKKKEKKERQSNVYLEINKNNVKG